MFERIKQFFSKSKLLIERSDDSPYRHHTVRLRALLTKNGYIAIQFSQGYAKGKKGEKIVVWQHKDYLKNNSGEIVIVNDTVEALEAAILLSKSFIEAEFSKFHQQFDASFFVKNLYEAQTEGDTTNESIQLNQESHEE